MADFVWVYEDRAREIALVRGRIDKTIFTTAGINKTVRYSTTGKGWVLPLTALADLCAAFDLAGVRYRFKAVAA